MKSWASKQNSQKSIIMKEKHNLDSFCHPYKVAFKWVYFVILIIVLLCSLIASCLIMYSAFIHLFIRSNGLQLNGGERTGNNYKCGSHYDRSKCRVQWEPRERGQGWIAGGCSPILTSVSLLLIIKFYWFFLCSSSYSCSTTTHSHSSALILAFSVICLNCYIRFLSGFSASIFLSHQSFLYTPLSE